MAQGLKQVNHTPLHALHQALGGKLVDFAGYLLPIQYPAGILAEHTHTRTHASLFDVSHMGQANLYGTASELEKILPSPLLEMTAGQQRYSFLLNEAGGIIDDLMITRISDAVWRLVVNAACKEKDYAHIRAAAAAGAGVSVRLEELDTHALLALQGPQAAAVMKNFSTDLAQLPFMATLAGTMAGIEVFASRSGYTGEDGYEISVAAPQAEALASTLLSDERVACAGLGARDTLRLEAGLCLYGQDIDEGTSALEAGLGWAIGKRRKLEGGFVGAARVQRELKDGVSRRRIGLVVQSKQPVRPPSPLVEGDRAVGQITSGGVAATQPNPIAMGYIEPALAKVGARVSATQRGRTLLAEIIKLPFRPHNYFKS